MKILLIVIGSAAIIAGIVFGTMYFISKNRVTDKGGMINDMSNIVDGCEYSLGGGMDGGSLFIWLSADENGSAVIEMKSVPYNGEPEESKTVAVPFEAVEKIRSVCIKYGVMSWGELQYSEIVALDAPSETLKFSVSGENFSKIINSNQELPEGCNGIFNEIYEILMSYLQGDD